MSLKKILAGITRADLDYNLIQNGDNIAIGVSGGKDSMLLLKALKQYQRFPTKNFNFYAVFLDLGFGNVDIDTLKSYCQEIDVKLHIENSTEVYEILKHHKNSSGNLPCSICSRMKKAAINKVAHQLNCNKVAFAHHCDDAIETLLMNTIYGGRIATFAPKMHLTDTNLIFIRPFILTREKDISSACKKENIPVIKSACPNDHITMREDAKNMLNYIYQKYPSSYNNYRHMLSNLEQFDLWMNKKEFPIKDPFTIKECVTKKEILQVLDIRKKVFVDEFKIPYEAEFNEEEFSEDVHYYIIKNGDIAVGTISYKKLSEKEYRLRRFAILPEYRRHGLGTEIFRYIESELSTKNNPIILSFSAMKYLEKFYNKLGFISKEDITVFNIPQVMMEKEVKTATRYKIKTK